MKVICDFSRKFSCKRNATLGSCISLQLASRVQYKQIYKELHKQIYKELHKELRTRGQGVQSEQGVCTMTLCVDYARCIMHQLTCKTRKPSATTGILEML